MERGIEQGEQQGLVKGEKQEAFRLVTRLLNRRLGELDALPVGVRGLLAPIADRVKYKLVSPMMRRL